MEQLEPPCRSVLENPIGIETTLYLHLDLSLSVRRSVLENPIGIETWFLPSLKEKDILVAAY